MNLEIRSLDPSTLGDYLTFFAGEAFEDNPAWASCYCRYHHADHDERPWDSRTAPGCAANYHGPLALYLGAGFEIEREYEEFTLVRKVFGSPPPGRDAEPGQIGAGDAS